MLQLINKEIDIDNSRVLFNELITPDNFDDHFITYNSRWSVEDGWIKGINPDESAGMAIFKQGFPGNVLLDFQARTVLPSTHDINFMWNGEWSDELNSCRNAYVGSICGWYGRLAGIEKSPEYRFAATVPNSSFRPGLAYHIQAGSIDGNCFIFIDGKPVIEAIDPDPLDNLKYTRVAFTAWSSCIAIKNIVIRQIKWNPLEKKYKAEI